MDMVLLSFFDFIFFLWICVRVLGREGKNKMFYYKNFWNIGLMVNCFIIYIVNCNIEVVLKGIVFIRSGIDFKNGIWENVI